MKGIYKITCKTTDVVYIGSASISFKDRWKKHKQRLRNQYHENSYLQNAWNKYGEDDFLFESLEDLSEYDESYIKERESYWLSIYFPKGRDYCFNLSDHTEGGNTVKDEEIRQKLSASIKSSYTDELREIRRQYAIENNIVERLHEGRDRPDAKQRHADAMRVLAKDTEWLKKTRDNAKKKRVKVGTDKGEIFNSVTEATEKTVAHRANIRSCIKGKIKTCMGRKWFYID